jgi:hypothetical protein
MVKWKKMNKKMAGLLLGVMMLFTASTTAFAYVDESAEASKVETTVNRQRREKGRGDKYKRGAAGRWNRQGNCIYDTWQW